MVWGCEWTGRWVLGEDMADDGVDVDLDCVETWDRASIVVEKEGEFGTSKDHGFNLILSFHAVDYLNISVS